MYLTDPIVEGKTNECEFMGKRLGEKYANLLIVVISSEHWSFTQSTEVSFSNRSITYNLVITLKRTHTFLSLKKKSQIETPVILEQSGEKMPSGTQMIYI